MVAPALGRTLETNLGENLRNILEYVDFMNIRSFEYWKFSSIASAPLYSKTGPNVNGTISYYIIKSGGVEKLIPGIEFSGTFLNDVDSKESQEQRVKVFWKNLEKEIWKGSISSWDLESQTPYIREEQKYLSVENVKSLSKKMEYSNGQNLGGLAIWSLEMDDDKNTLLGAVSSCGYNQ
ncbi:Protein CBG27252 [Caenorhabditis briggsae]|uniref:Protein CBG27252 n=1 Tax=Caenorhabditis briggsae TaxID=6238 RepID=B6IFX4_CAEBR|nr:Protein CBG27252 [Caenorhabditis briggsae]CAR98790.1 Protein CBG27252 [Caenorhabditis briggsae]